MRFTGYACDGFFMYMYTFITFITDCTIRCLCVAVTRVNVTKLNLVDWFHCIMPSTICGTPVSAQ